MHFTLAYPGFSLRSKPGLKLANAFGVNSKPHHYQRFNKLVELSSTYSLAGVRFDSEAGAGAATPEERAAPDAPVAVICQPYLAETPNIVGLNDEPAGRITPPLRKT